MKKLKLFFACLLMAVLSIGQVWAAEQLAYTLTPAKGSNNSYTGNCDVEISDITWNVNGNSQQLPWRLGGKSLSSVDRTVFSKTAMGNAITKVELTVGAASGITVNSLKLVVASNADFSTVIDEVTETFAANSTITFTPTSPATEWAKDAYYKFVFNVSVSGTNNKFVAFSEAKFYKEVATATCETPTFSPAAGTFYGEQEITLATSTAGASIYYTTDGTTPSSSNGTLYEDPFTITETKTVKAIAVKDGATDSGVAEATYTAGATVTSYNIDFETNNLAAYVNWVFDKLAIRTTTIAAHGGTYYAINATSGSATTGTATATITTVDKIATPGALTFWTSKESSNTTASSWIAQVSEDGDTWTDAETFDATTGAKGEWTERTADLSAYADVYVRIAYSGSTAIRAIDDISLSTTPSLLKPSITGVENFVNTTEVTISHATADAIYYTTDGTAPTTSSTPYSAPFELNATATVKAIAVKGGESSPVAEKEFTKIVPWSVAEANEQLAISTPQNGKYVRGIISQIDGYSSNAITYWISDDGSTTGQLEVYKGKNLNNTNFSAITDLALGDVVVVYGNLKVFEPSSGGSINEFDAGNYLISKEAPVVAAPVFSPDGGGFMGETDVTITCATEGSAIYYTLDGTTPSKSSSAYSAAIHLDATTTIKAIAYVGDDASMVVTKTFTLTAPMTVAEALTALESENPINNVAVAGIISTAPSSNPSSGKLTYYISDDGSASDELEVYKGFGVAGASFSDKTDLQVGDEVTVFGNLTIYNTTKEFAEGSRLIAFNRPVVPSISANPVAVDAAAHAGQSVTITYENWGAVSVADADATLFDDADCTIAFSGEWISNVDVAANFESVSFDIAANTGAARTAYMKIYALGDDATTEAEKVIAIAQEAYVAPALPASLPFAFDGGKADIATTQGMSQDDLDNSDYASSPKLKFKAEGAWVIIEIASAPGKLTYDIKGNSFSGGTFKVQESADGSDYSDVATYTELGGTTQNEEKTLDQDTRFVKFIYTTKDAGNVALGNIAIAEYVAPAAVETPAFSPAGGEYAGAQSVTISCETGGATIYYTTNGDDPDNTKTLYEDAINVDATMTIKAIAYKGDDHSEIATATYTITPALTDYYEKVTSGDVAEGTYLIVYETGSLAFNGGLETLDAASNTIAVEITNDNKIGVTQATAAATFYIDPEAGTIQAANGKYIGQGSDANGMATSDNALVNTLSIDDNGNAVIVSAGGAYLRYNATSGQERFRYFKSSSYTGQKAIQLYKLANEVIKPASGLAWDPAEDITLTVGDAFTAPALYNPNNIDAADITIASSNELVATVSEGVVSLVENATGTTTITATYTGETYKPITVSYKIKVNPASSIYVDKLNVTFDPVVKDAALPADKTITVTLNNVAAATATLGGTNPDAFSIDPATLTGSGNITISVIASTAAAATYSATITITDDANVAAEKVVNLSFAVTDAEPTAEETPVGPTSKWVPATEIVDGMQVLITGVKSDVTYAMGAASSNGNNRTSVAGTLEVGVFTPGVNTMPFTLVATGEENTYYIKTSNDKYLYNASTSGNSYLRTKAEQEDVSWTITLDGDGNAVITSVENTNRTLMRLNPNGQNNPLFNCYASGQNAIKLYVPQTEPSTTYTVTYDITGADGGQSAPTEDPKYAGAKFNVAADVAKEGLEFKGWEYDGKLYRAGDKFTMPAADVTLTAKWQKENIEKYNLITDASQLVDGMKVVIAQKVSANETSCKAMGSQNKNKNNRAAVDATLSGNVLTLNDDISKFTLVRNENGTFSFRTSEGNYLYAASSSDNYLKEQETLDANGKWKISFYGREAIITAQGTNARNQIRLNTSGTPFSCYGTGQQASVCLYGQMIVAPADATIGNPVAVSDLGYVEGEPIVVNEGQQLTIDENTHAPSLTVEVGAKVTVTTTVTYETYIFKASQCGKKSNQTANPVNITADNIYFDLQLEETAVSPGWYSFTVPFPVSATNGIYNAKNGQKLVNGTDYRVMTYDSEKRANGEYGWVSVNGNLVPGQLYMITLGDTEYTDIRFRKLDGASHNTADTWSVTRATGSGNEENDYGWNGIGNGTSVYRSVSGISATKYSHYDHAQNKFFASDIASMNFVMGSAFFIKAAAAATLTWSATVFSGTDNYYAPAREGQATEEFLVRLGKDTESYTDQLYVSASENASDSYEEGHDLVKFGSMGASKTADMSVLGYGKQLCDAEFPLVNGSAEFPLVINNPEAGTYNIYIARAPKDANLYLTYEGQVVWNLSQGAYEMDLTTGETNGYGLKIVTRHDAPTAVDEINAGREGAEKAVIDGNLYILRQGKVFDATGKQVK